MTLTIIRADESHLDDLVPLFDAYRQFYEQASDPAGAHAYLQARLEKQEAVIFLALVDAQAMGFTLLYPTYTSVGMRFFWVLNDLYVRPEGRQHGVGTALLERAKQHGIETHASRLQLRTAITNHTAQRVYEAHGWVRDEVFLTYTLTL